MALLNCRTSSTLLSLLMVLMLGPRRAPAQPVDAEYKFKAVYLYNFLQFVEWPARAFPEATTPITIGVLGENPFGPILDQTVTGEHIKGREIVVRQCSNIEEIKGCHLLFVGKSEKARLGPILSQTSDASMLTVSEVEGFVEQGGVINFFIQDGKLRFAINLAAAEKADLKISSKLLRLAKLVNTQNGQ